MKRPKFIKTLIAITLMVTATLYIGFAFFPQYLSFLNQSMTQRDSISLILLISVIYLFGFEEDKKNG